MGRFCTIGLPPDNGKMSHCWTQDGTEFSVVCSVVIGVSAFVSIVSIFCIIKICAMSRESRREKQLTTTGDILEMDTLPISDDATTRRDTLEDKETEIVVDKTYP